MLKYKKPIMKMQELHKEMGFPVDQDIVPEWFEFDRAFYEGGFREAVCAWWSGHVLVDQKVDELSAGYYRLKRCEVERLVNNVRVMLDNSQVSVMHGSSQVSEMWGNSQVSQMRDNSQVGKMLDNSQVGKMLHSSRVGKMWDNSTARVLKQYPKITILVGDGEVEMVAHKDYKQE